MAILYVASTGSNTSPYDTWAKAATAPLTATAAAAAGDTIYIHAESFAIASTTTFTLNGTTASPVKLICTNDKASEPPTVLSTGAVITGAATIGVSLTVNGCCYIYGVEFISGGSSNAANISLSTSDEKEVEAESCKFTIGNTNNNSRIFFGADSASNKSLKTKNCTFTFGNSSVQGFAMACDWFSDGDRFKKTTTSPSVLFKENYRANSSRILGADFTDITTALFGASAYSSGVTFVSNSKLASGVSIVSGYTNLGHGDVYLFNCSAGDEHYHFAHYNGRGETTVSTSIYANDGAEYNTAGDKYSWKIVSTANCSMHTPYVSPWIHTHHEGTSAITPYLEILRDGSTTAYQDDEVWAEFSYQGTTGFPLGVFVNDRMTLLGTPANQAAGVGLAGWTGEAGSAWSGKLATNATITPAEIGNLSARVCVGEPSITVYVDPQIRT
jgi:hypothetical protein